MAKYQIMKKFYNVDTGRLHLPLQPEDDEFSRQDIIEFPDDGAPHHEPSVTWKPLDAAAVSAIRLVLQKKRAGEEKYKKCVESHGGGEEGKRLAAEELLREANGHMSLDAIEEQLKKGALQPDKAPGLKGIDAQLRPAGATPAPRSRGGRASDTSPLG